MAYSEQVLHRARARLEQAKAEREQENAAHRADAYARYPRLAEIDNELRRTMAELMATALQRGEDPSQAVAAVREKTGWKRPFTGVVCGLSIFLLALTTALGFSVWHFQPFAEGTVWLHFWDFIVSTNILPLGSLCFALFCTTRIGWGWDGFVAEANAGKGLKIKAWMRPLFSYVVPAIILVLYIYGLVTFPWR